MKTLWEMIDKKKWSEATKYKIAILLASLISALAGLILWLVIRIWALSTLDWMFCFIGYPVILSWFLVFLYSCNHDFHDN